MLISKITIKNFRGIDILENLEVSKINTFLLEKMILENQLFYEH